MPKLSTAHPRYSKHKASGQAFVKIEGQFIYLGLHGSEISKQQYDRIIAEWLSNNRRLLSPTDQNSGNGISCSITRLCIDFYKHATVYYRKNGKQTGEAVNIKNALKYLRELYGDLPAEEFSPLKLQAVQQHMIKNGICRKSINRHTDRRRKGATQKEEKGPPKNKEKGHPTCSNSFVVQNVDFLSLPPQNLCAKYHHEVGFLTDGIVYTIVE